MDHSELETSGLATPVSSLTPQQDKDKFVSFEKLLSNSSTEMSSLSRRSLCEYFLMYMYVTANINSF